MGKKTSVIVNKLPTIDLQQWPVNLGQLSTDCWCYMYIGNVPRSCYRKIPKISPGAYIFQGPFLGAYLWREICVSKSIGLAL